MFDFCPHCGQTIEHEQVAGQMLICTTCGKPIGMVTPDAAVVADTTAERVQAGTAARCPVCQQAVDVKIVNGRKTLVPHYATGQKKICPGSAKIA